MALLKLTSIMTGRSQLMWLYSTFLMVGLQLHGE